MRSVKILMMIVALAVICQVGWQVAGSEIANAQLRDDMKEMTSPAFGNISRLVNRSDDEFREAVISKAERYNIELEPDQVTVTRSGSGISTQIYLAADYTKQVRLLNYSYPLHFTPETGSKPY